MASKNRGINIFRHVPKASPNRGQFPINHSCDFDGDFGVGYPVFCQEVLPGDTWHVSADHFSRLAPMIAPVYHDFDVKFHWFYVPMRLLWEDFEDWMTGGRTGTWREDNPDSFPLFNLDDLFGSSDEIIGTSLDFLGVNTCTDGQENSVEIRSNTTLPVMPIRGYFLLFNYFFRDQNVTEENVISLKSGIMDVEELSQMFGDCTDKLFFPVAWDKDYFTSATLSPQRGPEVFVPIGSNAPVRTIDPLNGQVAVTHVTGPLNDIAIPNQSPIFAEPDSHSGGEYYGELSAFNVPTQLMGLTTISNDDFAENGTYADLSASEGASINDVREAFALQRFFERMQVVGSRFSEFLRGIWGTNAGDARLQMPEYLGTWFNPFMINNVSNTTGTASNPQGGYAGNGMATQYNKPIHKNFPEYGYLYCIYSAMPRNGYQQGLSPVFTRRDWLDFANPYFEHIGEQPIKIEELYFDPSKTLAQREETFGYQSQYANYKFINSHSHGTFKTSLNFWHANRIFSEQPTLSTEFISYNKEESTDRVFVLPEEPKFYTTIQFGGYVERNLSPYSTPRII